MEKFKWFFIEFRKILIELFSAKKSKNDKTILEIVDYIDQMIALEEFAKKNCKDVNKYEERRVFNQNMQTIKNNIILKLNKIEFFD